MDFPRRRAKVDDAASRCPAWTCVGTSPCRRAQVDRRRAPSLARSGPSSPGGRRRNRAPSKSACLIRSAAAASATGFSWIDRRFVREGLLEPLEPREILLYFFLVAVADKDGLSYWAIAARPPPQAPSRDLDRVARRPRRRDLIAYEAPLYQVLESPSGARPRERRRGGWRASAEVLRRLAARREA